MFRKIKPSIWTLRFCLKEDVQALRYGETLVLACADGGPVRFRSERSLALFTLMVSSSLGVWR